MLTAKPILNEGNRGRRQQGQINEETFGYGKNSGALLLLLLLLPKIFKYSHSKFSQNITNIL